jgi:glycosyltransferase involved in cell wall biosynthesis
MGRTNLFMNTSLPQPRLGRVGVVALVPDHWEPQWQPRHQVLSRLASYFQVVWMNRPLGWRESLSALRQPRVASTDDPPPPSGMQIYQPELWLPELGRPSWLAQFTLRGRLRRASQLLRARGCTKLVLYIWRPEFADAIAQMPHDLSVYHIDDEYSFSPTDSEVPPAERVLLETVDQAVIHSPTLMRKKGSFNPHTEYVPNGVDFRLYATPVPEPEDLRDIPHPRIGYVGYIKRMLNWTLLLELSLSHPQWSFIFVGPKSPHPDIEEVLGKMSKLPNVHFLGGKPTDGLGAYPQHFDVCIMPYGLDDYTKYIYPLKLHEYLASGKPVVSAPIPAVEDFRHVVSIASDQRDWSDALELALREKENTPERNAERQRVASDHDWEVLVEKIARIIARRLDLEIPEDSSGVDSVLHSTARR